MSQENVNLMREFFQAFAGGDVTSLAGLLDSDVEWKAVEDPEPTRGFDGVLESLAGWFEVWDEVHVDLEELIDGGTKVVAVVKMRGRHAGSRSEVTERFFQVWTISDGKIVGFHEYNARHDACEAAGLEGRYLRGGAATGENPLLHSGARWAGLATTLVSRRFAGYFAVLNAGKQSYDLAERR
jgi:ketosteroid isomerase-like protein